MTAGGPPVSGRLLYVTARYPPYIGGTEVHTAQVAKRLAAQGVDVQILTTETDATRTVDTTRDGIPVRIVPARPKDRDYYLTYRLKDQIEDLRPDLVHVQGYHTFLGPTAMLAARRLMIPYVVTFHSGGSSSRLRNGARPIHQLLLSPLFRSAAALVAVSDWEAELFARRTGIANHRIHVIPSGSDLQIVGRDHEPSSTLITSFGRLERYKGHQNLIRALPYLLRDRPDTRLRIIGRGPYEDRLRKLVAKHQVEDHVEFTSTEVGDRAHLTQLLQESSLVALMSNYESQGLAAYEAISLGVPVMALRSSALAELVEHGLAAAIPPNTSDKDLARLVDDQLREPLALDGAMPPGWDRTVRELIGVYRDTLGQGPLPPESPETPESLDPAR